MKNGQGGDERDPHPRPLVIFGRHRKLLKRMMSELANAGFRSDILTGEVSAKARQKSVDRFQGGELDNVVGSYDAAGVGYTMIRSADFFVFEMDYTPALLKQAIDRIHRRGQTQQCHIYWFIVDNTIEARIAKLFVEKDRVAQQALGDALIGMFEPKSLYAHPVFTAPIDGEEEKGE